MTEHDHVHDEVLHEGVDEVLHEGVDEVLHEGVEHRDEHELLDAGEDAAMLDALRRQWWPWLLASGADPVAAALTTDGRPAAILVINTGLSREDLAEATPRIAAPLISFERLSKCGPITMVRVAGGGYFCPGCNKMRTVDGVIVTLPGSTSMAPPVCSDCVGRLMRTVVTGRMRQLRAAEKERRELQKRLAVVEAQELASAPR